METLTEGHQLIKASGTYILGEVAESGGGAYEWHRVKNDVVTPLSEYDPHSSHLTYCNQVVRGTTTEQPLGQTVCPICG